MPGIDECLLQAMHIPGARGAAVVDWNSGLALGAVGDAPGGDHETSAAETAELARLTAEYGAFHAPRTTPAPAGGEPEEAAKGGPVEDVIVTTPTGYHLLRFVETSFDSSVFVHLWLDRAEGNLALARLRLSDLAERLVLA